MALIVKPEMAWRRARAIASDVSLYNEKKIIEGIKNDDLFERLRDELHEGRDLYRDSVDPDLYERTNYFDRAVIDIIVRSKGHVESKIW